MAKSTHTLYVLNDNLIEITNLKDETDGSTITDATVTFSIESTSGTVVVTTTAMPHISGGTYRATLEEDSGIQAGVMYDLVIKVAASNDRVGEKRIRVFAQERRE